MYNSPTTPGGTGHNHSSNTKTCALPSGRPIGGSPPPIVSAVAVTITVASVGPYVLVTLVCANHRSANTAGNRSAPSTHRLTPGTAAGSNTPSNEGTTLAAPTPASRINACNNSGSTRSRADATTRVPPAP